MKSLSIKKVFIALLSFVAVFAFFAISASAEDYGNFSYSNIEPEDGEAFDAYNEITGYSVDDESTVTVVQIPDEIEKVPVTKICASAFSWKETLTEVIIPDTVTSIENSAFYHCTSLKIVVIPDSVKYIGESAFQDCDSLEYVIIGNGVTEIGDIAFKDCSSLKVLSLGSSVSKIGNGAFFDCSSLKNVLIPASVTSIGSNAFGLVQNGNEVDICDGFGFYAENAVPALDSYIKSTAEASEDISQSRDEFAPVSYVNSCSADQHELKWTKIRSATDSYTGLEAAQCSACFSVLTKENTEIEALDTGNSALTTLIICIIAVIAITVVIVIYVKKSKKRRLAAIALYKEGKTLPDKSEADAEIEKKEKKYSDKRKKQEAKFYENQK